MLQQISFKVAFLLTLTVTALHGVVLKSKPQNGDNLIRWDVFSRKLKAHFDAPGELDPELRHSQNAAEVFFVEYTDNRGCAVVEHGEVSYGDDGNIDLVNWWLELAKFTFDETEQPNFQGFLVRESTGFNLRYKGVPWFTSNRTAITNGSWQIYENRFNIDSNKAILREKLEMDVASMTVKLIAYRTLDICITSGQGHAFLKVKGFDRATGLIDKRALVLTEFTLIGAQQYNEQFGTFKVMITNIKEMQVEFTTDLDEGEGHENDSEVEAGDDTDSENGEGNQQKTPTGNPPTPGDSTTRSNKRKYDNLK